MSTLISLLVVGVAGAVVLWLTVGEMNQPATTDEESTGGGDAGDAVGPAEGAVPQAAPSRPAEPATADRSSARPHLATTRRHNTVPGSISFEPAPPITWGRRLRSTLGVVLVVTAVGLGLAASVGVIIVFVSRALEGAVN